MGGILSEVVVTQLVGVGGVASVDGGPCTCGNFINFVRITRDGAFRLA